VLQFHMRSKHSHGRAGHRTYLLSKNRAGGRDVPSELGGGAVRWDIAHVGGGSRMAGHRTGAYPSGPGECPPDDVGSWVALASFAAGSGQR
jgi:hypothetical protein